MSFKSRRWSVLATLLALLPVAVAVPSAASAAASIKPPTAARVAGCGGPLTFGRIVACPSIGVDEEQAYTVTTTKRDDTLYMTNRYVSGEYVGGIVTNPAGEPVCSVSNGTSTCDLGAAGTYTITMSISWGSGPGEYTLAVDSLKTPSSCTQLNNAFFSFATPALTATLPVGSAGHCYRFNQPVGSVLQLTNPLGDATGTIVDAAYEPICQIDYGARQCTLRTAGPYRLFMTAYGGNDVTYRLRMPRLTAAAGCPLLRLSGFGDPGANTNTATVDGEDATCHKVRANAAGAVLFRVYNGQHLDWVLYDQDAQQICSQYEHGRGCVIPAAGDYTLVMPNSNWEEVTYQVAATAIARNTGCAAATGTTWTEPTISVTQASLVGTHCQPFRGRAGDRIFLFGAPTRYNDLWKWIVDGAGTPLCLDYNEQAGCLLPATGTYRVVSYLGNWSSEQPEAPYELQVRRLNDPVGCPTVTPGAYGAAPAGAPAGIRCRILEVPTAGNYLVGARTADNDGNSPNVYDADFRTLCSSFCEFPTPGRYLMVLSAVADLIVQNDYAYATTFLPAAPSGCAGLAENGDPVLGEFRAAGQFDCLALAAPAGAKVSRVVPTDATGAGRPYVTVVDRGGAWVCDAYQLYQYSCELNGEAPFFALVDNRERNASTGTYRLGVVTVTPPPSCAALGNDPTGVTVTSAADRFGFCFTIPAGGHTAREAFHFRRTSGAGNATLSVFSADGYRYCYNLAPSADRTQTCTLPPEGQVTVLLETAAQAGTFQLTRRDATTP